MYSLLYISINICILYYNTNTEETLRLLHVYRISLQIKHLFYEKNSYLLFNYVYIYLKYIILFMRKKQTILHILLLLLFMLMLFMYTLTVTYIYIIYVVQVYIAVKERIEHLIFLIASDLQYIYACYIYIML